MKAKGIKIYLNPDHEEDRRVIDYLLYARESNTKAIVNAVNFYLDAQEGKNDNGLLGQIKAAVRESIQGLQIAPVNAGFSSRPVQQEPDDEVSMLDFIEALGSGVTSGESDPTFSG